MVVALTNVYEVCTIKALFYEHLQLWRNVTLLIVLHYNYVLIVVDKALSIGISYRNRNVIAKLTNTGISPLLVFLMSGIATKCVSVCDD